VQYEPLGHAKQTTAPVVGEYVPALQLVTTLSPEQAAPTGQSVQTEALLRLVLPDAHLTGALRPVLGHMYPAGQTACAAVPESGTK
jgi:hypothetical protein